jgi:hypothetical protein
MFAIGTDCHGRLRLPFQYLSSQWFCAQTIPSIHAPDRQCGYTKWKQQLLPRLRYFATAQNVIGSVEMREIGLFSRLQSALGSPLAVSSRLSEHAALGARRSSYRLDFNS